MNLNIDPKAKIGTILSLGGGIQSTALALMSADGFLPKVDCAIFADTHWEPQKVYDNLQWLIDTIEKSKNPFPIHIVDNGRSLKEDAQNITNEKGDSFMVIPIYMGGAKTPRNCTWKYKILPIHRKAREIFNPSKKQYIDQWIGISMDEFQRMKTSPVKWINQVWPLIDLKFTRDDCVQWLNERYPKFIPYKSSCIGCPFHNLSYWEEIKNEYPDEFQQVVEIEKKYQEYAKENGFNKPYFSRHEIPLDLLVKIKMEDGDDSMQECAGNCFT